MNRLVLIGNGFDLAHGLKTSYADFINWYWKEWGDRLLVSSNRTESDELCSFTLNREINLAGWYVVWTVHYRKENPLDPWDANNVVELAKEDKELCTFQYKGEFFERINKGIETKGWVDIENEYYDLLKKYALEEDGESKVEELNKQLGFLQDKLVKYLNGIEIKENIINGEIRPKIYVPFEPSDIAIGGQDALKDFIEEEIKLDNKELDYKFQQYGYSFSSGFVDDYRKRYWGKEKIDWANVPKDLLLPNQILLLNFNYTKTAQFYCKNAPIFNIIQIHGELEHPSSVIFGYGDELDEDYKKLMNKNENTYLGNIKSVKYLESDNYRKMLSFIESEPYQVVIMGHSCGNSDRTLLHTIFEHKNCVSIKPYFYKEKETGKDNYLELIQNISRNFTDMKLMRDRVVNKTFTRPLTK